MKIASAPGAGPTTKGIIGLGVTSVERRAELEPVT